MWHEARRREKATQKLLHEHKKRSERRREENRIDPNSLLQINGLKSKLYLEPGVYKQAVKSLVAWQGDKNITIDRFDVRATLSSIPSAKPTSRDNNPTVLDSEENVFLRKILNYERYRLLIQNDLNKVPEELRLKLVAKSDIASDAKMNKLRNNKFGTSGESFSNNTNAAAVIFNRHMQFKNQQATRKGVGGAAISYNYNFVPPPACLSDSRRFDDSSRADQTSDHDTPRDQTLKIVDEIDNFELDGIVISNFEAKKLNEIAKKYGLSGEELTLLARRDKDDLNTAQLLKEIIKLNKNKDRAEKELKNSENDQVYGPALPPGMKTNHLSPSSEDEDNDDNSPVRQRSPSGASIPLRNGSNHDPSESPRSENDSKATKVSDGGLVSESNDSSPQKILKPNIANPSSSPPLLPPEQSSSHVLCDISTKRFKHLIKESKDLEKCASNEQRQSSPRHISPRRASTPLLYKRNCRSSRSLSRERRHNRYHQSNNHKSSRRSGTHRSRSSSYSTTSTSNSTSSSHSRQRTFSPSSGSESSREISKRKRSSSKSRKRTKKRGRRRI